MESLFEMRYHCSQKMLAEFARKHQVGPRPPIVFAFAIMYAWLILLCVQKGIFAEVWLQMLIFGMVMVAVYFLPNYVAWATLRNVKKQNDGVIQDTTVAFGDIIEVYDDTIRMTIEYRKIIKVIHLKHSYVLMNGKRTGLILDPNAFTKGTFSEFKQFLRTKRPDLKIPE